MARRIGRSCQSHRDENMVQNLLCLHNAGVLIPIFFVKDYISEFSISGQLVV